VDVDKVLIVNVVCKCEEDLDEVLEVDVVDSRDVKELEREEALL
jgi:hypothetical protein